MFVQMGRAIEEKVCFVLCVCVCVCVFARVQRAIKKGPEEDQESDLYFVFIRHFSAFIWNIRDRQL